MRRPVATLTLALIGTTVAAQEGLKRFTVEALFEDKAIDLEQLSNLMRLTDGGHLSYWTSRDDEKLTWGRNEPDLNNPQYDLNGYRPPAPLTYTQKSKAILLLVHGTMDNEVHVQQSLPFNSEFAAADKLIELMIFPRTRHDVIRSRFALHFHRLIADSFNRYLFDNTGE
jgi:hypothetical protein